MISKWSHFPWAFFSCIFPLYPPNPHKSLSLSLCSEIGYTMRERRDKQTWVPVLTAAVEDGESQTYKEKRGNKHPLHLQMQYVHLKTHIWICCQKICTYSHTHTIMTTLTWHRERHTNPHIICFPSYKQHIMWTQHTGADSYLDSFPFPPYPTTETDFFFNPPHTSSDKPALLCYHKFVYM